MEKEVDWIVIGRFGRAHGIKGMVTVHSFTEPRENILRYTQWHAMINKQWQPLELLRVEVTNKHILALVEGFADREKVEGLTNIEIAVLREQLPQLAPGDYYWHELVGMQVVDQQGACFGTVVEIMPTGSNDVMVVEGEKRYLIPYIPGRFVTSINALEKLIIVDWDTDF